MVRSEAVARSKQGTKRSQRPQSPVSLTVSAKRLKTADSDLPNGQSPEETRKGGPCRRSAREATKRQTAAADLTAASRQRKGPTAPRAEGAPQQQRRKQQLQQQQHQQPAAKVNTSATAAEQQITKTGRKRSRQTSVAAGEAELSGAADRTSREDRETLRQTHVAEHAASRDSAPPSEPSPAVASEPDADHGHAAAVVQPTGTQAVRQSSASAASDAAEQQAAAAEHKKRAVGVPHPTFKGVVTTTEGVRAQHVVSQVKQLWSAFVTVEKPRRPARRYIGRFYHSPEAAARAVDRANIALHGREVAELNFPQWYYGPEEQQRCGADLERWLRSLAGTKNNNPKDAPGVPYVKPIAAFLEWQKARLSGFRQQRTAAAQKGKAVGGSGKEPMVDPDIGWRVWKTLTGRSAKGARPEGQHGGGHWHSTPCGQCTNCKQAAWQNSSAGNSQCLALPKLQMARRELTRLANSNGQQRFTPADLQQFLASLPDPSRGDMQARPSADLPPDNGAHMFIDAGKGPELVADHGPGFKSHSKSGKDGSFLADVSAVPGESRGGARKKGVRQGGGDTGKDDAQEVGDVQAEHNVSWTREQASAMQTRDEDLYQAQEQDRVLAAETAPSQGCYQPLLASCSAPYVDHKHKWPDHHMADIRHIQSCARQGSLVEVRNHERWREPALGTLGPPGDALQGSLGLKSDQELRPLHITHCCLCKADDHLIKNCPLNSYYDEAPAEATQAVQSRDRRSGPKAGKEASQDHQAGWLGAVQRPVKDVMSSIQQMASAAVQVNEHKDSKHSNLWESMTPDALLACGLLVDELMRAQIEPRSST